MCGIIGAFQTKEAFFLVQNGLCIMRERGKDGSGYYDGTLHYAASPDVLSPSIKQNILGHNLHAIVHMLPQPLRYKGAVLISNCEIYNWEELGKAYRISARNDSDLLLKLLQRFGVKKALDLLRGVYAFAYWEKNHVYLVRDILGVKPLWYSSEEKALSFASEKKTLHGKNIQELNPRQILRYSLSTGKISFLKRDFFSFHKEVSEEVLPQLQEKLFEAVRIRVPQKKFGLLFSGGLDSLLLAKILKDLGQEFTCYTAATSEQSSDLLSAKDCAKELGVPLRYAIVSTEETERYLQKIVPLIEDSTVMKVGVALPLYIASELAKHDGNKVIFSGSGADELFGGYERYKTTPLRKLNQDCYSDILKVYERNCYRDDVITMNNGLELRVPFLDKELVALALRIAPEWKIRDGQEKYILRKLAIALGLPKERAERKKKAAQYGSGFDQTIEKLAKKQKKTKSAYLAHMYRPKNLRLCALVSGGKDSLYAAYIMAQQNYDLSCLLTMQSANPHSFMFHTPNVHMVALQAEAMQIPLIVQKTRGEKEKELEDLRKGLEKAKKLYAIEGVISGALYSEYQRGRIETVADTLGLKIFAPLWHKDQEHELQELLKNGFQFILSSVAAEGLNKNWLGKVITEDDVQKLVALHEKNGLHIAFEGGEAESLVLDCPLFTKRLRILSFDLLEESEHTARIHITKAELE